MIAKNPSGVKGLDLMALIMATGEVPQGLPLKYLR
jgi:hypothetical protein